MIKLMRKTDERVNEVTLNMKAGAISQHVATVHHYGASHNDLCFGIVELVVKQLSDRITADRGVEDDEEFWRLASQLASGVADLYQSGILHLALEVRTRRRM